jgi:hypothetical protein
MAEHDVQVACAFCGEGVQYTDIDPIALGIVERWRPYDEYADRHFYAHRACFAANMHADARERFEQDRG